MKLLQFLIFSYLDLSKEIYLLNYLLNESLIVIPEFPGG
jgi:hypothetical protein